MIRTSRKPHINSDVKTGVAGNGVSADFYIGLFPAIVVFYIDGTERMCWLEGGLDSVVTNQHIGSFGRDSAQYLPAKTIITNRDQPVAC